MTKGTIPLLLQTGVSAGGALIAWARLKAC